MDFLVRLPIVGQIGGLSHESEHDLGLMVSDFLENDSVGSDSICSSDSEPGFSDLSHLADKILFHRHLVDQYEIDLLSVVQSLMLSIEYVDLHPVKSSLCNASCIRHSLVKLLRTSGYDAAVCTSRWQSSNNVPGGDHEYMDVMNYDNDGNSERLIIDIDFRSHFEIARAVEAYDRILNSLPVVYVGKLSELKQFLHVMAEASKSSLKQNSMPFPPWRSLAYLNAKWRSPYQRLIRSDEANTNQSISTHSQCRGHLRRFQYLLQSEIKENLVLNPVNVDRKRKLKFCKNLRNL